MLCVSCAEEQITYSGTMNGDVCVWKDHNLDRSITAAHSVSPMTDVVLDA